MTDGDQAIVNMLTQMNGLLLQVLNILKKMKQDGVQVRTQESHAP